MMKNLIARFKKKVGPLPMWSWVSIASAAGWYYLKRKNAAAADATAAQTAADTSLVSTGDTGDLSPNGSTPGSDTTPATAPGEAFPDKNITSNFKDFMNQLYAQELANQGNGTTGIDGTTTGTDGTTTGDGAKAESTDPITTKSKPLPTGVAAVFARLRGGTTKRKVKPKKKPLPHTGGRRSSGPASHGSGGAGARPRRRVRPRPRPRPRRPVRPDDRGGPRTTARPRPAPRHRRRRPPRYRGPH